MAGERATFEPTVVVSAVNLTSRTFLAFATLGLASIDTRQWESFVARVNVLSFVGSPAVHVRIQHSAANPSSVSYDPWAVLWAFPPISTAEVFTADLPNDAAPRIGGWIRFQYSVVGPVGSEIASIGDVVVSPRG